MLLLLEALTRALIDRGHVVTYAKLGPEDRHLSLIFDVRGAPLDVKVEEKLTKVPHEWTKEEKERNRKWGFLPKKKWDHVPSGVLDLSIGNRHWGFGGVSWRDTKRHPLESRLGQIVLEIEGVAELAHHRRKEYEEEQAQKRKEELAWRRRQRLPLYETWLTEDLEDMLKRWEHAKQIRAFMDAFEQVLPPDDPVALEYLQGVRAYADGKDPLTSGETIAKTLSPSDERLEEVETMVNRANRRW